MPVFQSNVFQNNVFQGPHGAGPVTARTNWDTSDPLFADWWRDKARKVKEEIDEPAPIEAIEPAVAETARAFKSAVPKLQSLEFASTAAELRMLSQELTRAQRHMIERLIAEYERQQDDEDTETILLMLH